MSTDDLLGAALARANRYNHASNCPCDPDRDPYVGCACGETRREDLRRDVLALVERVREAEAGWEQYSQLWQKASMSVLRLTDERDSWHQAALTATAGESRAERERDEARGKLDKVRQVAEDTSESVSNDWGWGYDAAMERVLAILDGKTGD